MFKYQTVFLFAVYSSVLIISALLSVSYFHLTNEDAWITFKYARNLADGYGLVENPGDTTQEGYSTLFLVFLLASLKHIFNFDITYSAKIIGIVSIFSSMVLSAYILKIFFFSIKKEIITKLEKMNLFLKNQTLFFHVTVLGLIASIGLSNYFYYWATQGLETTLYSVTILAVCLSMLYAIIYKKYRIFYITSLLSFVSLNTRPEGIMNFFVFLFIVSIGCLINYKADKQLIRHLIGSAVLFFGLLGLLFLLKEVYFGDFISNPSYFKIAVSIWQDRFKDFVTYSQNKGLPFTISFIVLTGAGIFFIIKNIFRRKQDNSILVIFSILSFLMSQGIFIYYIGGDYMLYSRFIITHYPFIVLLFVSVPMLLAIHYVPSRRKSLFIVIIPIIILITSGIFYENIKSSRWNEVNFISPNEMQKSFNTEHYKAAVKISEIMKNYPNSYYAISEFGYIPYHVDYKGLDIIGLNQKEIARNFKHYDILDAFAANRDFILSKKPKVIITYGYWLDKNGQVKMLDSVKGFFGPYFESRFFLQNYDINYPPSLLKQNPSPQSAFLLPEPYTSLAFPSGFFGYSYWNGKYQPTRIIEIGHQENYDKLLFGFFEPVGRTMWVSTLSRVLLQPDCTDNFLNLKGYIPDISKYPDSVNNIQFYLNGDSVGDKFYKDIQITQSGNFHKKIFIKNELSCKQDTIITMRGSKMTNDNSPDKRDLSFVFESIYFSKE